MTDADAFTSCSDADFAKYNEREEQMRMMATEIKKLQLRLETYEKTQTELQEQNM
jgi:hypothetical protein